MDLKAQRATALKSATTITELATSEARDLTAEETEQVNTFIAEVEALDAKIEAGAKSAATASRLSSLAAKSDTVTKTERETPAKSFGEHAARELDLSGIKSGRVTKTVASEFKAAGDPTLVGATTITTVDRNVVGQTRDALRVADLLSVGQIDGNALTYFIELAKQGQINAIAEGTLKSKVTYTYEEAYEKLSKIAGLTDVSDEMLDDLAFVVSAINGNLVLDLLLAEDNQLLNGDGTGSNVLGLLNRSGVLTQASTGLANNADAIFSGDTKVAVASGLQVSGRVMHPATYESIRLLKDTNGNYLGGGPFGSNGVLNIWGQPVALTTSIAIGVVLSGAMKSATVLRKGGVKVDLSKENKDNFERNITTFRAEERIGLMVPKPGAFVITTLATV